MSFLLFVAFTFYFSWRGDPARQTSAIDWLVVQTLGALFVSVILHEIGHVWTARRLGGQIGEIVLGPLGGLARTKPTTRPRAELLTHLAGPAANLLVCFILLPALLAAEGGVAGLLHPLAPDGLTVGSKLIVYAKVGFWINWSLAVVNMLPVFPFDGARALQAGILTRWPGIGRRLASFLVAKVAKFMAVGVFLASFVVEFEDFVGFIPMRFALLLLSIFLFFCAQHEEQRGVEEPEDDPLLGGELAADLPKLERELKRSPAHVSGPFQSWLARRRWMRAERQRALESEEEHRVDEILARLHEHGRESLSPTDRDLLQRVSARYRSRLHR
jgi:Zn-dependent protease